MNIRDLNEKSRGSRFRFLIVILLMCLITTSVVSFAALDYVEAETQTGTVNSDIGLNLRAGPGTTYPVLVILPDGATVTILEKTSDWLKVKYGSVTGYVSTSYVTINSSTTPTEPTPSTGPSTSNDADFEKAILGFPDSYRPYLRTLHKKYPNWVFRPLNTGLNWVDVITKETKNPGTNLVPSSWASAYKSYAPGALTSSGSHIIFDSGGYVAASVAAVKYYMDPRNFLNENSIFQFLSNKYDGASQKESGVNSIISGSFMDSSKGFPEPTHATYAKVIMEAGKKNGVNPLTLASIILTEQGYNGKSDLISGKLKNYEGYYNYFNVGAFKAGGRSAVENGLLYAKKSGWNTRVKAIVEGASFYATLYVNNGKFSIYLQKFNVMNGLSNVATGQYMTAVYAANTEGVILKKGYNNQLNSSIVFEIPVYKNMPDTACAVPTSANANNNITGGKGSNYSTGSPSSGSSGGSSQGTGSSTTPTSPTVTTTRSINRIAGANKFQTSTAIADSLKKTLNVSKFNTIVIASGDTYYDGISAAYLAAIKKAPVLLVNNSNVSYVAKYVKNNLASGGTVYITGGPKAISYAMDNALPGIKVKRLYGAKATDTNLAILRECGVKNMELAICSSLDYSDALSASSIGKPIMLVGKSLTKAQLNFIKSANIKKFYVIGGPVAVSEDVANTLKKYAITERIYGQNKYTTSTQVAKYFFGTNKNNIVLAYGDNFADALSAGPLAYQLKAPVVLVSSKKYTNAKTYVKSTKSKNIYVMGGTLVIPDSLANQFK